MQHPVAKASAYTAQPCLLYLDGVPTVKKDGVLGIWVHLLLSDKRHLICTPRKSKLCKCGCKGWCTMYRIMAWLHWSFQAAAVGTHPGERPLQEAFTRLDERLTELGGQPLEAVLALIGIKGDWSEFCSALGFSNWKTSAYPCLFCFTTSETMGDCRNWTVLEEPFAPMTYIAYDELCSLNERHVVLTVSNINPLRAVLRYDRRKGIRGRCIVQKVTLPGGGSSCFQTTGWSLLPKCQM